MIRPVSGRKPLAGSSVVMRHCSAAPRSRIVVLAQAEVGEGLARRDAHLRLHEVDVGDLLGDGVLDLDARVHLDEDVLSPLARVEQELDRAGVDVADRLGERDRVGADPLAQVAGSRFGAGAISTTFWWRRCTEQSRSKRWTRCPRRRRGSAPRCGAGRSTACSRNIVGSPNALSASRMRPRARPRSSFCVVDAAHAAAAAAGDRLGEDREADLVGRRHSSSRSRDGGDRLQHGTPAAIGRRVRARPCCRPSRARRAGGPMKVMPALAPPRRARGSRRGTRSPGRSRRRPTARRRG